VLAAPVFPLRFRSETVNSGIDVSHNNSRIFETISNSYLKYLPIYQQNQVDIFISLCVLFDGLCGLVVKVPGYRSRGSGLHSRSYQIFWQVEGEERGPLSLVRIIEELLE
jgi:hypothetical protein